MHKYLLPLAAAVVAFAGPAALAKDDQVADPQATWDLTELYPSVEAWNKAREEVTADFEEIDSRRGTLGESAESLYATYRLVSDTLKKAGREEQLEVPGNLSEHANIAG